MKNSTNDVTMTSHDNHLFWRENSKFQILILTHLSFRFFSTKQKFDRKQNISSRERGFNSAQDMISFDKNRHGRNHEKCIRTYKTKVIIS